MYTIFLNVVEVMDIKMNNFYLDLLQRLIVGAYTGYVTFDKRWDTEATGPLQTLPLELVEVNTQQIE